jgi:O-antigen ligase
MFLIPFLNPYHFYPLTNFYTEWLAFAIGVSALAPMAVKRFWEQVEIPTLALWLLAFAGLLLAQLALLDIAYPEMSLLGMLYVVWAAWLVWLGRVLAKSCGMEQLARLLAAMLVLGGLLNAAAALVQFYDISFPYGFMVARLDARGSAYGNFGQNNHFADYVTLALISVLYLRIRGWLTLPTAAICIAIFLYVLTLSGSRSTWLYFVAALALSLWFRGRTDAPRLRRAALTLAVLLPLFWLVQYAMARYGLATRIGGPVAGHGMVTPDQRFIMDFSQGLLSKSGGSGLSIRLYMWHQALLMWSRAPLLGVGFGQYAGVFFEQAAELSRYHIANFDRNAHNALMQLLAETGLLGTGLVCAGLGAWLRGLYRRFTVNAESWWMLCLLSILFVHSMLEYPLWHADFLGVAAILLGMGSESNMRLHLSALSRFAFPVMMLAGVVALGSVLHAYRDLEELLYPRVLPKTGAEILARNQGLLKVDRDSLLAPYVELSYAGSIVADRRNLQDKLALERRVMHFMPVPSVAYRQILLLGLNGQRKAALLQLDRAVAVFPYWLKYFVPAAEKAAQGDPAALGDIAKVAREKLKQVDRNER